MRTTNYLLKFAKMNEEEQILTLSRIGMNETDAKELLAKIINELKTQETLLYQVKSKQDVTNAELIEKLQRLKIKNKNAKTETKTQRLIRLHYFDIRKMREENYSWQEISKYIAKQYHRKIYYTTIMRTYKQLEQELNL
jgi:hypothetical protein